MDPSEASRGPVPKGAAGLARAAQNLPYRREVFDVALATGVRVHPPCGRDAMRTAGRGILALGSCAVCLGRKGTGESHASGGPSGKKGGAGGPVGLTSQMLAA